MIFGLVMLFTCITLAMFQLPACKSKPHGQCTYEGLECPNALQVYLEDSVAYADCEYVADSLAEANDSLKTVIAGLELKDHSEIPQKTQVVGAGMIHMFHDEDGAITLVYREHDGNEYYLDYAIDDFFVSDKYRLHAKK